MTHHIHHVPGRLRARCPGIKRNDAAARRVRRALAAVKGIWDVEVRTVTGSVLVRYDPSTVDVQVILRALEGCGLGALPAAQADSGSRPRSGTAARVTEALVQKALETLLERSAMALLAAVL
jgi:copper chaperone CopZ